MRYPILLAALWGGLSACTPTTEEVFSAVIDPVETDIQVTRGMGPPDADPNACYGREVTPAVIETVTEQVMLQPPQISTDGAVREPAIFMTETQQRIVQERRELWFETPCQAERDPEFIASLQRALEARGHYHGPINGEMDTRTRRAIRAYQRPQGLDSPILSLAAARQLGIAIWDPELAAQGGDGG
ncbi:peptidoglycan-binding protein [Maritalea mobilis]|uniref:peptidoglycan-binding domain-containing protein n=1 Tax=Maritalea mobilis TaxID=483324 RepID=UPI001C93F89F|nr:peptidoglycan-binding domain-containing protein [Maritalea mobilis]MBY6202501.1 peptidoglycan-binding protein [Maritalea mobilis]